MQTEREREARREKVLEDLARNGMDHVRVEGVGGGGVGEEEVKKFFEGFRIDQVCFLSFSFLVVFFWGKRC
jgi:hypothetical protein